MAFSCAFAVVGGAVLMVGSPAVHRPLAALTLVLLVASSAPAHHRQTPPIVPLTTTGEGALPRLAPTSRKAAAVMIDGTIAIMTPFKDPTLPAFTFTAGSNANPSISSNGRIVAWDTDADPLNSGAPGTQIVEQKRFDMSQLAVDMSGTSKNPAVDVFGLYTAFESTGALAGPGSGGTRQIFLRRPDGTIVQISRGTGTSRNPSLGRKARFVVFESTSDPSTGNDTGVAQVWVANMLTGSTEPITAAVAPSTNPSMSNEGRVVVFESRADLGSDGHDTGATQIFAYDTVSETFARVTNEPGGCTLPTSANIKRDWRIAYLCGGRAYFSMLRADERFEIGTGGVGDTSRLVPQTDTHFMLIATTADMAAGSGTTAQHRVYMVNLFKHEPLTAPSNIIWFPFQGLSQL